MKKTIAFITAATVLATGGLAVSAATVNERARTGLDGAIRANHAYHNQHQAHRNYRNYANRDGHRELLGHTVRYGQDGRAISNYRYNRTARNHGEGIGSERTMGRMTFVMVDRDNPSTVLETFTTEVQTGRYRAVRERNIPGWRVDRQGFRNNVRANRGSQTITVPMVRDETARNVDFGIRGQEYENTHHNPAYGIHGRGYENRHNVRDGVHGRDSNYRHNMGHGVHNRGYGTNHNVRHGINGRGYEHNRNVVENAVDGVRHGVHNVVDGVVGGVNGGRGR